MKTKKPEKNKRPEASKKSKKIKTSPLRDICFELKSVGMAVLALVCVIVFGICFLGNSKLFYGYDQKETISVSNSKPVIRIMESAAASEDQPAELAPGTGEDASVKEKDDPEADSADLAAAKEQTDKEARAKRIARKHAAEIAEINNAPILAGPTKKLPDGKRVCPLKNPQPSGRGGKPHIDEDCCADYDEYPNPRCDYSPSQMAALKKE